MEKFTKDLKAGISDFKVLDEKKGTFEAYVSIFNNVDYADEVIEKGAFAKSIAKKLPKIAWAHNWDEIIGKVTSAIEDDRGLKIAGQLVLSVQKAKEAYDLMKEGATDEFSIGYGIVNARYEERNGKQVRVLTELDLYEISPVLSGCNPETELLGIKSNEKDEEKELKEITEDDKKVKFIMSDDTEMELKKNQIFDNYLTEKSGVKVANNSVAKKLLIIKKVYKKKINIDNFLYKQLKDLDI